MTTAAAWARRTAAILRIGASVKRRLEALPCSSALIVKAIARAVGIFHAKFLGKSRLELHMNTNNT
jgi:hypothetical protein